MTYRLAVDSMIKDDTGTQVIVSASSYENDAMIRFLVPLSEQEHYFMGKLLMVDVEELDEPAAITDIITPMPEGNA